MTTDVKGGVTTDVKGGRDNGRRVGGVATVVRGGGDRSERGVDKCGGMAVSWGGVARNQATLAVMPFAEAAADEASDYFGRGFVEDLITDLSRFSNLSVLALHSTASSRAPELRPDFSLRGSLRRAGDQLRVTAQLIDNSDRSVAWAERFDAEAAHIFVIQDQISAQVVSAVSTRIHTTLTALAKRKPTTELLAYDHWLRGFDCLKQGTLLGDEQAREWFHRALTCDPHYARAYLGLSLTYFNEWTCQLWQRWDENEQRAHDYAARALELDQEDHYAQLVLGRVLLFRREFERAEQHVQRCIGLNPNDADCLVQASMAMSFLDHAERGRELFERAQRLDPYHEPWYFAYGGVTAFVQERYAELVEHANRLPLDIMVDVPAYLAVAHLQLGHRDEARTLVQRYVQQFTDTILRGRSSEPGEALRWIQHTNPYRNPEHERRLLDGVRSAGLHGGTLPIPIAKAPEQQVFRRVGSLWQASFAGKDAWLPHLKGNSDIATLLAAPGQPVHCSELMGAVMSLAEDTTIDLPARQAYQARIAALREQLAEAQAHHDISRAEVVQQELDALFEHVASALGLGGRSRKLGSLSERARSAVTQRIKIALKRIADAHDALGRHLAESIQTGTFCTYSPPIELEWRL